jgi:hypothetical protein
LRSAPLLAKLDHVRLATFFDPDGNTLMLDQDLQAGS